MQRVANIRSREGVQMRLQEYAAKGRPRENSTWFLWRNDSYGGMHYLQYVKLGLILWLWDTGVQRLTVGSRSLESPSEALDCAFPLWGRVSTQLSLECLSSTSSDFASQPTLSWPLVSKCTPLSLPNLLKSILFPWHLSLNILLIYFVYYLPPPWECKFHKGWIFFNIVHWWIPVTRIFLSIVMCIKWKSNFLSCTVHTS